MFSINLLFPHLNLHYLHKIGHTNIHYMKATLLD